MELNLSTNSTSSYGEETTALMMETTTLLKNATEQIALKRLQRGYLEITEEYEKAIKDGAKALIRAASQAEVALAKNSTKNADVERARNKVRDLDKKILEVKDKKESNEAKIAAALQEIEALKAEEAKIEEEFEQLGGEKAIKKKHEEQKASSDAPLLKRAVNLYRYITRIKFDFTENEKEMKGTVVDSKLGQVAQFRFPINHAEGNDFAVANRVWSIIG